MVAVVEVTRVGAAVVHGRMDEPGLVLETLEQGVVAELRGMGLTKVPHKLLARQPPRARCARPPASPAGRLDSRRPPRRSPARNRGPAHALRSM
jgi:hypothetical protein